MSTESFHNEKELFILIAQGDELAFKQLFDSYVTKLYPYILEVIKSPTGAEDILQDCFVRIWLNRDKLDIIQNPSSWIFKITLNECYNVLRRKMTENKVLGVLRQDHSDRDHHDQQDIQYAQTKRFIAEAIGGLTPQRKRIYELSRINGLKVSQIAIELDLSVSTVKNTLSAALTFIREHLATKGILYSFLASCFFFA